MNELARHVHALAFLSLVAILSPTVSALGEPATDTLNPSLCYEYNPWAVTNACLSLRPLPDRFHNVTPGAGPCLLGYAVCAPSATVEPPSAPAQGYAELTTACLVTPRCRFALG